MKHVQDHRAQDCSPCPGKSGPACGSQKLGFEDLADLAFSRGEGDICKMAVGCRLLRKTLSYEKIP